jgi:cytochrome bd-type quinol oxidase subunit 1
MNYPAWQLAIPGGLLIGMVAVLHVFLSHFAIGGGAYLVLAEHAAYKKDDAELLAYVRRHARFFALLTVVLGAVTGVGIWFTISLVSPEATSSLIHAYVWGWAIEWVFFFVEIAAALIYVYQWDRLSRRAHLAVGWIYAVAAWLSLAVINGIITYMLTPGRWLQTRGFWDGFFNPTYFPSLLLRTAMAVALAGMFGLVTARGAARERLVRRAGAWLAVGVVLLVPFAAWYRLRLPAPARGYLAGGIVAVRHAADAAALLAALALVLALVFALWKPRWMNPLITAVLLACGLVVMGSGEYIREVSRKPWSIGGYIYANDVRAADVARITASGAAAASPWIAVAGDAPLARGHALFAAQCGNCHSRDGYRAIRTRVRGWDAVFAREMLLHLTLIRGPMPEFAGNQDDRAALGQYLAAVAAPRSPAASPAELGRQAFAMRCALCHTIGGQRRPLPLAGMEPDAIAEMVGSLSDLSSDMPPFTGGDAEKRALAEFLAQGTAP